MKNIDLAALLSITTGRMLTDFTSLHDAVQWCSGQTDDLATIGVMMMAAKAKECILAQYPDLPCSFSGDWGIFVEETRKRLGSFLPIQSCVAA